MRSSATALRICRSSSPSPSPARAGSQVGPASTWKEHSVRRPTLVPSDPVSNSSFPILAARAAIPCLRRCIYTNTAGFGPMPRPVWEDLRRREEAILEEGLDVLAQDPNWCGQWETWRERLGAQFGADADEIALGRALGEGLNM